MQRSELENYFSFCRNELLCNLAPRFCNLCGKESGWKLHFSSRETTQRSPADICQEKWMAEPFLGILSPPNTGNVQRRAWSSSMEESIVSRTVPNGEVLAVGRADCLCAVCRY